MDLIVHVLRPELAVNLTVTVDTLLEGLQGGLTFAEALARAGRGVPERTAHDPQTVMEVLMWNRALHDEEFRQTVARSYESLDESGALVYGGLMDLLGREPRPPFAPNNIGAIVTAIAQGLASRASLSPGLYPDETFGWIVCALVPLLTRDPDDDRTPIEYLESLGLGTPGTMNPEGAA